MKKLTQLVGVFATSLICTAALAGCSATPDPTPMSTGGAGGTGAGGGGGAGGGTLLNGTLLTGMAAYTILSAGEFMAGPTPAPAAWTSGGCITCHGNNGEGSVIGPEIRHVPTNYANAIVRNGRLLPSGMPSAMVKFPDAASTPAQLGITSADLTAVLAWLQGQPKPATGVALYRDFCGNCHGPKVPSGGAVPISVTGRMKTQITQKVRIGEGMDPGMRNGYMPAEDMAALSDTELGLIQDYLMAM